MKECKSVPTQKIIELIGKLGVDTIFTVPGAPVLGLLDELSEEEQITIYQLRDEATLPFAALGYYEETGNPAVVLVTTGPGGNKLINGVANAVSEEVPMIVLCPTAARKGGFQWSRFAMTMKSISPVVIEIKRESDITKPRIMKIISRGIKASEPIVISVSTKLL